MAINIKFDLVGNPEPPTIILANRNGNKLGQLQVNIDSIELKDRFNNASEISFTVNKYLNNKITNLWDKIVDFKLVYCKEWDMWFEIKVEVDEATETVKTVYCTQLGQAELSQIMLFNIHINEEGDSNWNPNSKVYKSTILYDEDEQDASLLHRLLKDKAPHYSIGYVSPTIRKIQRSFSFDSISIYDALQEIAEEIGCLFIFHSSSDENGKIQRVISAHDLQQNCRKCGHRGEFTDECPKCGGQDIEYGYGEDTTIFVTSDELASEGIQLSTDTDSVKNCFKLEAGDDLMTAAIRSCNPNGTDYIWYFSDAVKSDMSPELVEKINAYDELYQKCKAECDININDESLQMYNELVDKYLVYNDELEHIDTSATGYPALMNAYYNAIDLELYLESGLMPSVEMIDTDAKEQAELLNASSLSPVAVPDVTVVSVSTANSAVLRMAEAIVSPIYDVKIPDEIDRETFNLEASSLSSDGNAMYWNGNIKLINCADDEDFAITPRLTIAITDDMEESLRQQIDKALNKDNTEDYSVSALFKKEIKIDENGNHIVDENGNCECEFCAELKKYALNVLDGFYKSGQSCLAILTGQGAGNKDKEPELYKNLYEPYYLKTAAIDAEKQIREREINIVSSGVYDVDGSLEIKGVQENIKECISKIQEDLDFKSYLGDELWTEFCSYRREDVYSNENYISEGLNNAELFEKALEFFNVAENEIYKSAELQHSISTSLNNLLAIPKFKPLINSFKTGNWIRVLIDGKVYKLRLLEYDIGYGDLSKIPVEFSDVTKIKNGITDVEDILSQASSMATSYNAVQRQADQGSRAKTTVEEWISDGLNSAMVQIQNNDSKDITVTRDGILCLSYDELTGKELPEQLKITRNIMAYTDDGWRTVRQAIGKHDYIIYDKDNNGFVDKTGYGISADFVTAGVVSGSQIIGGDIYSDNYSQNNAVGSYLNLRDGTFSFGGGSLRFDGKDLLISSPDVLTKNEVTTINEDYIKTTNVYAENLQIKAANIQDQLTASQINTTGLIAENISATEITGKSIIGGDLLIGDKSNTYAEITSDGILNCNGANITGTITATAGEIGKCKIDANGNLQITNANISEKLTADKIDASELEVDAANINGKLIADQIDATNLTVSGANITGKLIAAEISADKITGGAMKGSDTSDGAIQLGKWNVGNNSLWYNSDGKSLFLSPAGRSYKFTGDGKNYSFALFANGNFGVTTSGILYATGAHITGEIIATSGDIGGWNIGDITIKDGSTTVFNGEALYSDQYTDPENSNLKLSVALTPTMLYVYGTLNGSNYVRKTTWSKVVAAAGYL